MLVRFPSPTTYLCCPPKFSNGNLSFSTVKDQCISLLNSCCSMQDLTQIHAYLCTTGLVSDGYLISEILRFCSLSPLGSLDYAQSLLLHSPDPIPTSCWNNVIRGNAGRDCPREAIAVFLEMRKRGGRPNNLTFPFLLKACARLSALSAGRQIQVEIVKNGLDSDVYVQNSLIHFYGSCREISDARYVFDMMRLRTVVSWNAIISAYVERSQFDDSIGLFAEMRLYGIVPDEASMVVLLSVCAELGNLSLGNWAHCQAIETGLVLNCRLGTALVDMYAKCGNVSSAGFIFERMLDRNVWTWSAMISGLAQHGLAKEALDLFLEMKNHSIRPNYVTFLGVLCACSHAGLVDDGWRFFHDMKHVHGIEPKMTHYGAMVDILGRAGLLTEAYRFILHIPVEPDPVVWRTLLSACSSHDPNGSTGILEKVRNKLIELEPRRSGNFVMVANLYAEVGLWKEASNVRKMMRIGGMKKMAGESSIQIGGCIHRFLSGDDSLVDRESIYWLLHGLYVHMKMVDYDFP
ncbi:pentatricopeptide repeat-containing protein At2g36730 [Macadamia integrifolia]|uniref:pentatricopeptide repeat-containing protein At2g36730 n=1 Tax=Macadamia integrifolia TaxID=60698 RepID=UPI001C5339FF|nr:pentatricopeptide repeat-containing protein At2g36730 [Macadamia integrifolia]